ncbi:MAG TPA: hypothetical protein VHP83_16185 [Aggregatilineaceae bacterium]|nr:hypothetical protein [Aggregatilineaceae bacterium]
MQRQTSEIMLFEELTACYAATRCPVQVLVIDRVNGPANILIDTIGLLMEQEISVLSVENYDDAIRAMDYYYFDVVVVGLDGHQPRQMTVLPVVHAHQPDAPILVVGRELSREQRNYARYYGARDVWTVPERAAELKTLLLRMAERYFVSAQAS